MVGYRRSRLRTGSLCILLLPSALIGLVACAAADEPCPGRTTPHADTAYVQPIIPAPTCDKPPVIDATLTDDAWERGYHATEFWNVGLHCAPAETTEIWLCVDSEALYVAVYAHDSKPSGIRCEETKRGGHISGDDYLTVGLDQNWDGGAPYAFQVTPRGTQSESIAGGSDTKVQWRGDWTAAARVVADGWIAEMRIPFRMIRYATNQTTWGIYVARHHARTAGQWYWPPQPIRWDGTKLALLTGLRLPHGAMRPTIMPTLQSEWRDGALRTRLSLDAKYTDPRGYTGLLAWKPDFSDIEGEVESIDFSYTERAYDDKRPFFVEGGSFLPASSMFYSRRIPQFDIGIKTFGSFGDTSFGALYDTLSGERHDLAVHVGRRIATYDSVDAGYTHTVQPGLVNSVANVNGSITRPIGAGAFTAWANYFHSDTSLDSTEAMPALRHRGRLLDGGRRP